MLGVALAVEFADELADGVKGAALPGIQHALGLSYGQIGLLASLPLLVGGLLELPVGLVKNRRLMVLGGGVLFVATLAAVAFARNFAELLIALIAFYPASGAFVSLTQASLMDADPDRHAQLMARWDMAGWAGAVAGPLLLVGILTSGGGWRDAYLAIAVLSGLAWLGVLRSRRLATAGTGAGETGASETGASETGASETGAGETEGELAPGVRAVVAAARRWAVLRWLILLEIANWLVDVLTGFVAIYLVNVVHASPAVAALVVAIRLGAGLAGDAVLVVLLERVSDTAVLRASAAAAALLYPAFLLVPGLAPKVVILAVLSAATATWYPLLQARLYGTVPSSVAVTLSSAASMAGGLGPLAVGLAAGVLGLPRALAGLSIVPVLLLVLTNRERLPAAYRVRVTRSRYSLRSSGLLSVRGRAGAGPRTCS
jgi:MFS transporter, FSR family, fosmidomycin resistance protein